MGLLVEVEACGSMSSCVWTMAYSSFTEHKSIVSQSTSVEQCEDIVCKLSHIFFCNVSFAVAMLMDFTMTVF